MPKPFKPTFFWLLYAVALTLFATTMFRTWVMMISVFFGIFFLFRFTRRTDQLTTLERQIYHWIMVLYPLAETAVQWMAKQGWLTQNWMIINRVEHSVWAMFIVVLFSPIFSEFWKFLKPWQNLLCVVGSVCLLGNLIEFLEFYFRLSPGWIILPERSGIFYTDTILDMMMNLLGGSIGFLILWRLKAASHKKYPFGDTAQDN
jgi:hypothetical protein